MSLDTTRELKSGLSNCILFAHLHFRFLNRKPIQAGLSINCHHQIAWYIFVVVVFILLFIIFRSMVLLPWNWRWQTLFPCILSLKGEKVTSSRLHNHFDGWIGIWSGVSLVLSTLQPLDTLVLYARIKHGARSLYSNLQY